MARGKAEFSRSLLIEAAIIQSKKMSPSEVSHYVATGEFSTQAEECEPYSQEAVAAMFGGV